MTSLEQQRDEWNATHRIGAAVTIRPMSAEFDPRQTCTRSRAWIVFGRTVMVMVAGSPGVVPIDAILPASPFPSS